MKLILSKKLTRKLNNAYIYTIQNKIQCFSTPQGNNIESLIG